MLTESDDVLIEAVAERLQSAVTCQINGIDRSKVEREQRRGLRQRCQHAYMNATGQQGSLSKPYYELLVLDRACWRGLVHTSLPCFQQGTPIHKAPERAPDGPCYRLTFAKLFTDTPLHVCCGTRPLQAHQTANGFCHSPKKRVDCHGHAPVDCYPVVNRQPLHMCQSLIPEWPQMPGCSNPDLQQHRDGLFSITALCRATDGKLMA
jgi:hypothetical protein